MKYVLLIVYLTASNNGWETTKYREAFESMKECQVKYADWKMALGTRFKYGQCYYQGNKLLPGDCKAWGEYSRRWTNFCSEKGNDITHRCLSLETPPSPYDQCK